MVSKHVVVLAVILVTLASAARAFGQDRQAAFERPTIAATMPGAGPLRTAIERIGFDAVADHPAARSLPVPFLAPKAPPRGNVAGRVVFATVAGIAGFFGGGILGAKIEGPCSCDDPGLEGAVIGAPIGAVVGAVAGWKVAGLFSR
jgi:hypothetical protein